MNIWSKMMTALRGGVNEAGEAIVDSQALRILDQEVRDASEELKQSKGSLAEIMARQKLAEEKVAQLQKQIDEHEGYAIKALEKGDENLAREVAEKIASLENQQSQEKESAAGFSESVSKLRTAIQQSERNIKRLKQQVDTVKATENVQRAQAAVAERHSGSNSKMRTAMDSLERIKEKQALKEAQMSAASELAESDVDVSLQTKLEEAGIASTGNSADDILERLKKKS
ncbi:PspA/IM30 family protein [Pseudoteredinibacter isoporae]|uniref:Phage shock protein A n=1 Tax=Pseudoteredinibacter isoporae TaxID=570281 RepID=A0A7X0JWN1_9GAMM|nr:PspA/IM30 family protein [Pseudoteredinibacter isoporae]MBB6523614.1 phage shock protein A [Pseudoteredinibacter isoporae]NHO89121.1 PspA/IM30 family protein [Pseudoteredinibacter isoporae]NIB22268.1 PspA/IM30 family protein [Pseudoteredinibacter isoporae]